MNENATETGFRTVKPPKRKQQDTPSRRAREARRLVERLDAARADRRIAWPEGQPEYAAERQEQRLADLHGEKRIMRRDIYREAPVLEGTPVQRHVSRPGS